MNHRKTTILANKVLGVSGTEIIELNIKDKISHIDLTMGIITGNAQLIDSPREAFTKIEILDGSNKLFELSSKLMDAMQFFDTGNVGTQWLSNSKSELKEDHSVIMFGRFEYDPLYAFDPIAFKNPQMRVTWNAALSEVNATAANLKVIAECFDEKEISPVGFMRDTSIYKYVPAAAAYEYVDLPTDLDIRKLLVQPYDVGVSFDTIIDEAKLTEDNDKHVPFDMTAYEWIDKQRKLYPRIEQSAWFFTSSGGHWIFGAPSYMSGEALGNMTGVRAVMLNNFSGNRFACSTGNATDFITGRIFGELPWSTHCWPFGNPNDPEDWYKPQAKGSVKLRLLGGADDAVCTIALQQIHKY